MENDPTLEKNKRYSAIATLYTEAIISAVLKEKRQNKISSAQKEAKLPTDNVRRSMPSSTKGSGIFAEDIVKKYEKMQQKEEVVEVEIGR